MALVNSQRAEAQRVEALLAASQKQKESIEAQLAAMQTTCGTQDAQSRAAKTDQMLVARGLLAEQVRNALSKQSAEGTTRKEGGATDR